MSSSAPSIEPEPTERVASVIDEVMVYRSGAMVTRVGKLARTSGAFPSIIRLTGLPLSLADASLNVRIGGGPSVPIAADVKVGLEVPDPDPSLRPPDDAERDAARQALSEANAELADLMKQRKQIDKLDPIARPPRAEGEPPGPSPTEARLALITFFGERMATLDSQIADQTERVDQLKRRVQKLEEAAHLATSARQAREHELRKTAVVRLTGDRTTADAVQVKLQYFVPGARWAPSYAVRLSDGLDQAEVVVRAMVAQRSGEDWANAQVCLSTASAQRWTELPEMKAVRIGRRQPAPAPRWRPPPAGADELYADYDGAVTRGPAVRKPPPPRPQPAPEMERTASFDLGDYEDDIDALEDITGAGGPSMDMMADMPMPAAAAPPPPMPMPVASRGPIAGAAPPGMVRSRAAAPSKAMKKKGAPVAPSMTMAGYAGASLQQVLAEHAAGGIEPEPEPILDADDRLLRYGALKMAGPDEYRRGHLIPQAPTTWYMQLLIEQRVEVHFDVVTVVERAVRQAQGVARMSAPKRHKLADSEGGYDYAYPCGDRVDVPSDGAFHAVVVASQAGRSTPRFVTVPRESQDVFRTVELENPLDAPLLPGPADIYVKGNYLMTADIASTPPKGKLTLGLGVEQAVKVSRNSRFSEQTAGIMRGSNDLEHTIEIELANHLARSASVEVRERIPVLQEGEDDIKLTVGDVSPAWGAYEDDDKDLRGGYRWRVSVPPGERMKLTAEYTVRISSSDELVGGNRRER